ncbi:hypothetical protein TOL_3551 [Thalassolituus oleivorans MIL-1]|uniref:Uncharacterized protein n=1 Tax=Thalassolituus oleivorans MIL-1 TaxID=1298593 RepID=M5E9F9_9GAMM|nr:hypothetical protein TOL_3551 [Thalassolituus oleivorans MIL-1]
MGLGEGLMASAVKIATAVGMLCTEKVHADLFVVTNNRYFPIVDIVVAEDLVQFAIYSQLVYAC